MRPGGKKKGTNRVDQDTAATKARIAGETMALRASMTLGQAQIRGRIRVGSNLAKGASACPTSVGGMVVGHIPKKTTIVIDMDIRYGRLRKY